MIQQKTKGWAPAEDPNNKKNGATWEKNPINKVQNNTENWKQMTPIIHQLLISFVSLILLIWLLNPHGL